MEELSRCACPQALSFLHIQDYVHGQFTTSVQKINILAETVKVHIILNIGQGDSLRKGYPFFSKVKNTTDRGACQAAGRK